MSDWGKKEWTGGKKMKKLTHKSDRIAFVYTVVSVCASSDMILLYYIILLSGLLSPASSHIINNNNT